MLGTSISLDLKGTGKIDTSMLCKESWHKLKNVINENTISIHYSYYDSYSIKNWSSNNIVFILEGLIFNIEQPEIEKRLHNIAVLKTRPEIKEEIASFIKEADGDYIITIYNKEKKQIIIFNDILGGMALHYSCYADAIHISRSLSYVVINNGKLDLSKEYLSENVTFGYNVGDHTIFKDIKKLTPGSCIIADVLDSTIKIDTFNVVDPNFSLSNPFKTKKEAIKALCDIFIESCRRRVEYAKKNNYEIVNTMSGGYDSRTVLGGIERFVKNYINLTYEYKQDESEVAKKVLNHIGSQSEYIKQSFNNQPVLDNSALTFETDGKIIAYTNSLCYNDLRYCNSNVLKQKNILYFGGFGGEYIRHPFKAFLQSPNEWLMSFSPSIMLTAGIFNSDPQTSTISFNSVMVPHLSGGNESIAKFFYNEYYQNLVRCSGEERTRLFFNTVQPMMCKDFILTIRNRVPLKWVGFGFYTDFLKEIDSRLVEVELYKKSVDIKSKWSLFKEDFKNNISLIPYIRYVLRKYTRYEYKKKPNALDLALVDKYYNELMDKSIINIDYLKSIYYSLGRPTQLRVLTILEYISECEKHISHSVK